MQTIDTTFKAQQAKSISLRNSTAKERRDKLKLLLKNFLEMENDILAALSSDLGKSKTEALLAEIYGVKAEADFAIKNLEFSYSCALKLLIILIPNKILQKNLKN
mgnify:CR=1 FL=1